MSVYSNKGRFGFFWWNIKHRVWINYFFLPLYDQDTAGWNVGPKTTDTSHTNEHVVKWRHEVSFLIRKLIKCWDREPSRQHARQTDRLTVDLYLSFFFLNPVPQDHPQVCSRSPATSFSQSMAPPPLVTQIFSSNLFLPTFHLNLATITSKLFMGIHWTWRPRKQPSYPQLQQEFPGNPQAKLAKEDQQSR